MYIKNYVNHHFLIFSPFWHACAPIVLEANVDKFLVDMHV